MQTQNQETVKLSRILVKDVGITLPVDCDTPTVDMGGTNSRDITLGCRCRCSRPCPLPEKPVPVSLIRQRQSRRIG